jgi:uncharacterized protein (TIGR00296 family)
MLTKSQGKKLLALARDTIKEAFSGEIPEVSQDIKNEFHEKQGVFVTLHEKGKLRGCIGYPMPSLPLFEAIISAARSAAFQDPRFSPLRKEEMDFIDLEISVLTIPELIDVKLPEEYIDKINIGEDGLIIKFGMASGLLLPQVATEYEWTEEEFLMHTCNKAGLHSEAWKEDDVKLYKFQAQIFSEKDFHEE